MRAFGEYLASRPVLARRLAVNAFVLMAGVFLMMARTSPALAADNSHGQGKAQDRTSASAVVHRQDSPMVKGDYQIGGDGNSDGKGKPKTTVGSSGAGQASGSAAGKADTGTKARAAAAAPASKRRATVRRTAGARLRRSS